MDLTLTIILREMIGLLPHFPEAGYTGKTLTPLARDWFELLQEEHVSERAFLLAIREVKKRCRFWPKLSEVLQAVQQERSNPTPVCTVPQLADTSSTHDLTLEERERNKRRIGHIVSMLKGQLSMDEALQRVCADTHIAAFDAKETTLVR